MDSEKKYKEVNQFIMTKMQEIHNKLKESNLPIRLIMLLEVFTSEINGCEICYKIHKKDAMDHGVPEEHIINLKNFENLSMFSEAEKEALKWNRAILKLDGAFKLKDTNLSDFFSKEDIKAISLTVGIMSFYNRYTIGSMKE